MRDFLAARNETAREKEEAGRGCLGVKEYLQHPHFTDGKTEAPQLTARESFECRPP